MADNTKIEWTDATWNPITGCSVVSPGCTNCYAMKLAGTRLKNEPSRKGLTRPGKSGPVWTGEVRFNEQWLDDPLRWKRPRRIFVCAHGDLFAENVPDEWIDRVFAVMALSPQHTFQVLTKRAERMREYLTAPDAMPRIYDTVIDRVVSTGPKPLQSGGKPAVLLWRSMRPDYAPKGRKIDLGLWPLPNVWLGVSVEDQRRADERIPALLATPAAVRWISAEPLLGPVDLTRLCGAGGSYFDSLFGETWRAIGDLDFRLLTLSSTSHRLDWVVVGGESGPGARVWPGFDDACRSLRNQCKAASVSFFMKQMQGERKSTMPPIPADLMIREMPDAR